MTDIQADIMEIKQTLKAMQADIDIIKRYNNIYDQRAEAFYATMYPDVTTKPFDWNEVPDYVSVYKPHNDEYVGGPVAGYCPDYMKEKK